MSKLPAPKDLSDEELSQQLYNCAAFLTTACEEEDADADADAEGGGGVSLELVALLLLRAEELVVELGGGADLEDIAAKADDEDLAILAGTAAGPADVPEEP